jgi:hypothetical protein
MQQSAIDQPNNGQSDSVKLGHDEIQMISEGLFTTMLNMKFETEPESPVEDWENPLVSRITITGDWDAEIRIVASHELAKEIACNMFAMTEDELENEEIHDALGEVANIIGGNAKGIVDQDCKLSLPCVGSLSDFSDLAAVSQNYACDGHRIEVLVSESN